MTIDLHLNQNITEGHLQLQLSYFEQELDRALVNGEIELVVIHGIGEGVLKAEVHKIANQHPHVSACINDYHQLYGFGSSRIIFK